MSLAARCSTAGTMSDPSPPRPARRAGWGKPGTFGRHPKTGDQSAPPRLGIGAGGLDGPVLVGQGAAGGRREPRVQAMMAVRRPRPGGTHQRLGHGWSPARSWAEGDVGEPLLYERGHLRGRGDAERHFDVAVTVGECLQAAPARRASARVLVVTTRRSAALRRDCRTASSASTARFTIWDAIPTTRSPAGVSSIALFAPDEQRIVEMSRSAASAWIPPAHSHRARRGRAAPTQPSDQDEHLQLSEVTASHCPARGRARPRTDNRSLRFTLTA